MDPHTNVGSLALAVMDTQSVCACERVSSSPPSVPATGSRPTPGPQIPEQKSYLYMDILVQQQLTYSKSFQKTQATSTLARGSYSQQGTEGVDCKPGKVSNKTTPFHDNK